MSDLPTIKGSAQARLLLYRLLSTKLNNTQKRLLDSYPNQWEQLLLQLEDMVSAETDAKSNDAELKKAFSYIEKSSRNGLERQIERLTGKSLLLGVFPQGLLENFINEYKTLIKSVEHEHLERIGLALKRGLREGQLSKDIAKEIQKNVSLSKRRAQLIARNAPLQYSGAITKHHQISAGIKQYRWQSSQDERVRNSHRTRNGTVYDWKGPGPHPRSEVNCRCDAIPVLDL
jgi:SPP1 gp7 family putative phage head morphogenesis protein